jgi:hypothetical protein
MYCFPYGALTNQNFVSSMKSRTWLVVLALSIVSLGCEPQSATSSDNSKVEMIFWEAQSWEAGGGKSRITIWADGRSEIVVVPDTPLLLKSKSLRLRDGWRMEQGDKGPYFVRENVYPEKVAKDKFDQALAAGIRLLKTFRPDYVDGNGTVVGVQVDGELKETVIPMFLGQHQGSANHKRFVAVSNVLADFDRHAYDIQN